MDRKATVNTQTETQTNQPSINYGRKVEVAPMRIVERDVPEHLDADQLRELVKKDQAEEKKSK